MHKKLHNSTCSSVQENVHESLGYSTDRFLTIALSSSVTEDRRGSHDHSYHTISEQSDLFMQEHVNTFEPGISHYRLEHVPHRLYVDPLLLICDMYESYKKHCAEKEEKALSLSSYSRKIKSTNISFAKLGHEECEICIKHEEHKCTATESQNVLCECHRQEEHKKKKDEARDSYREDRSASEGNINKGTVYLSHDLQKVRMLPEIPGVKSAVFTSRICTYNETFSPIGKGKGKSYAMLWHQGIAGHNDEDIASTFYKFLYSPVNRVKNHIILWMDNCSADNKNWTMFSALVALVNGWSESALESITLKFFEAGHSYMSADLFKQNRRNRFNSMTSMII